MNFSKLLAIKEAYRIASSSIIRVGTLDPTEYDPLCSRKVHASTDLICQLCSHLKKTPIFIRPNLTEGFGQCHNETKLCNGMLGLLQRGEIDIVANIYIYVEGLFPILQYTNYIQEIEPAYIYGPVIGSSEAKVSDDNMNLGLTNFCYVFIFSIFALVFLLSLIRARLHNESTRWFDVFWQTFEGFLGQDFRGKLVFFSFFPIVIITQIAFKGQALSATYPKLPFSDTKELANLIWGGKYKVILPSLDVQRILIGRVPEMKRALDKYPADIDFKNSLSVRKKVCRSSSLISLSYMERYMGPLCKFYSQPDVKYLGDEKYYMGAMVSRYVPKWLFERIQRTVIRVFSPDVYRYWILSQYVPYSYTNEVLADSAVQQDGQIKIVSWMKCLCAVLVGYIISIVAFWIEMYYHWRQMNIQLRSNTMVKYRRITNIRQDIYKNTNPHQQINIEKNNWYLKA